MSKNIILITIDALRGDHTSCLGYDRVTTPNQDNIAKKSVLFTQAIATGPETRPSVISLLTSTYPLMYRGYTLSDESRVTIAEILKENGYSTAAFHSNPYLSRLYGYDKGFDTFYDSLNIRPISEKTKDLLKKHNNLCMLFKKAYNFVHKRRKSTPHVRAEIINKKAISWLQNHSDNFFLWLHYMDVHIPYMPSREFMFHHISKREMCRLNDKLIYRKDEISKDDVEKLIDLYDAQIRHVDIAIKSFLDNVEKMGKSDSTFIIITADHGEEFKEHMGLCHTPKLYDELIHVPLIIRGPGLKNATIKEQVSLLDLAPTILDLLNIQKPKNFQGNSLLPLIKGAKVKSSGAISEACVWDEDPFKINLKERRTSYRTEKWKYILNEDGSGELYNLQEDPEEKSNLVDKEVEKTREFKSKVLAHIQIEKKSKKVLINEKERIKKKIRKLTFDH